MHKPSGAEASRVEPRRACPKALIHPEAVMVFSRRWGMAGQHSPIPPSNNPACPGRAIVAGMRPSRLLPKLIGADEEGNDNESGQPIPKRQLAKGVEGLRLPALGAGDMLICVVMQRAIE